MHGLYLLLTKQLEKDLTIKFGMSMRLEYRWIDYLAIFADSRYVYYYELLDNLSRNYILDIEDEIIQLHKTERNELYQTEYFYCSDYDTFHKSIIDVLDKKKVNYYIHNVHNFNRTYYDNKPESFVYIEQQHDIEHDIEQEIEQDIEQEIEQDIEQEIEQDNIKQDCIELITPHLHQQDVLNKIEPFYNKFDIGKLIHACGLGKALLGILIVLKLNFKMVVIGVPSIYLQKQMKNEIMRVFNDSNNILYIGGQTEKSKNYIIKSTTKEDEINEFIKKPSLGCKFIISTYDSCDKLSNGHVFDFKIGDEAHHLVGSTDNKTKEAFHNIKSNKTLFMTATEKVIEHNELSRVIYSMDDKSIFGELVDTKSICWAIENNKITDYNLIILKNSYDEINNIIDSLHINTDKIINKNLFVSGFMALKSIEKYDDLTHILIYTNTTSNAELVEKYIDMILKLNIINLDKTNYYNKALHSKSEVNLNDIKLYDNLIEDGHITKFKKASWGIISSVHIFGEGFDCVELNGVVFAENMESDIRIVQSVLRPNRLNKKFPNKKAYVIIPYCDNCDNTDNESFEKCRKIIAKIRNVDERIEFKINVGILTNCDNAELITESNKSLIKYYHIIENDNELTKIMLRLRYSKALGSQYSEEQDEFNYIRQLNKELNIQSKEEYNNKITQSKHINYIENAEEYFRKNCVWTNWYDFMGIDTNKFIQSKNDWIDFCKEKNIKSIEEYKEQCIIYTELPQNPADFYIGFVTIPIELGLEKKRRK
jgi:predicted helicase